MLVIRFLNFCLGLTPFITLSLIERYNVYINSAFWWRDLLLCYCLLLSTHRKERIDCQGSTKPMMKHKLNDY